MKKPKVVQCDVRGQIVIPKSLREKLRIDDGTAFWIYDSDNEHIELKRIAKPKIKK